MLTGRCAFDDGTQSPLIWKYSLPMQQCKRKIYFIFAAYALLKYTFKPLSCREGGNHGQIDKRWEWFGYCESRVGKRVAPQKNRNLNPEDITSGSSKEVWWLCPKGHSYLMVVNLRTKRGYGCPYCSGHRALKGINDLATTNPDLAQEWNYDKNIDLTPCDVTAGSRKKVWWRCEKGHVCW